MDVKINDITTSERELEATLKYDEFKDQLESEVIKQAKKIQLPGFRKGKVPISMIKKMYGDSLDYEASEKIANKQFWEISKKKELNPIGQPVLSDIKFKPGEDLYFKVKFEVYPTIEIKDYKGLNIDIPDFKVKDEDIEKEIKQIKKANTKKEKADKVGGLDYIIDVEILRINDDGKPYKNAKSEKIQIDLSNENVQKEIIENSKNKKVGDKFNFSFKDERNIKNSKGEDEKIIENFIYEAEIKEINKSILPDLNEEFVKKLTKDKVSTEQELREEIRKDISKYFEQQENEFIQNKLISAIVEKNDFVPPSTIVSNYLENLINHEEEHAKKEGVKNFNKDEAAKRNQKSAEYQVKWHIIKSEIEKKENIVVNEEDLKKLAEKDAGKTGITVEKLLNYYKSSNYSEKLKDEKLLDFLKENNNIKKVDPKKLFKNDSEESK
ncbi:MAG: trigger factor [Bacteroidetes bacterium]|nr:trigger factor [Bacteroidota bacterium]